MNQKDRENRVEAAARAFYAPVNPETWAPPRQLLRNMTRALDAADAAVPMVSLEQHRRAIINVMEMEMLRRCHADRFRLKQELREAEATARDFAKALGKIADIFNSNAAPNQARITAADALFAHPDFTAVAQSTSPKPDRESGN